MEHTIAVRLAQNGEKFFGPGLVRLLTLVDELGSLRMAAKSMDMAYSKAWKITKRAEEALGFSLLLSKTGGSGGGGAELTQKGREFIARYVAFEKEVKADAARLFEKYYK